jgi:hypothetical protein
MNKGALLATVAGFVLMTVPMQAMAADSGVLAKSNAVQVTGGYYQSYTTQVYEQTGSTSRFVQTGTVRVQTGTTTVTKMEPKTESTWHSGYWVETGHWDGSTHSWVCPGGSCGYWSPGYYGAPYYTVDVPVQVQVPVYQTYPTGYYTSVPIYGWVNVPEQRWIPATVSGN